MIRFYYNNYWKNYTPTYSSQHPSFPAINTQKRWPSRTWRSRYGAGSGWGSFVITASSTDRLDFSEGGSELHALLTPGVYTVDTLCAHLKARMQAVGALTYTWTYNESGTDVNKFTVAATAPFALHWNSGTNKARSIASTIGFDDSADDYGGGISTFTADWIRIHTAEYIREDFGASIAVSGVFIRNHNLQSTGYVGITASNDAWATYSLIQSLTVQSDILAYIWDTPQSYRYWGFYFRDSSNPAGYVEAGPCFFGPDFEPTRNYTYGRSSNPQDISIMNLSSGGQLSTIQKQKYRTYDYKFLGVPNTDNTTYDAMFNSRGFSKDMFYVENDDSYLTTAHYVRPLSLKSSHVAADGALAPYWDVDMSFEELR